AEPARIAMTLWAFHTHLLDTASHSPFLAFTSPQPRCGKTTAQMLMASLVYRPMPASNISPSAVFRSIETWHPTLLIDEAETFLGENEELRGILNSGNSKSGALVIRTVGDDHTPAKFSTWAAKTLSLIGALKPTLADRSIHIRMERKGGAEVAARITAADQTALIELRDKAARWSADSIYTVAGSDPVIPDQLHDRAADNWRHLLAIADVLGGDWPARAREAAIILSGEAADESDDAPIMLLKDIQQLFDDNHVDRFTSEDIVDRLAV